MTKSAFSKTQIDRLGDRLREGPHTESDLRLLDDYRRSFGEAYEVVVRTIRQRGGSPTGRPAKSTRSIVEKLRRESIRLSQMQDIAGCRIVVVNIPHQEQFVASLKTDFPGASVMDRREKPSYGYRAVHVIAEITGKPIEIQVRSPLQHLWAELSEKASDILDPTIKYGGGPDEWRKTLTNSSELVAAYENLEKEQVSALKEAKEKEAAAYEVYKKTIAEQSGRHVTEQEEKTIRKGWRNKIDAKERKLESAWNRTAKLLNMTLSLLDNLRRQKQ